MKFKNFLNERINMDGVFNYYLAYESLDELLELDYSRREILSIYEDEDDIHYTLSKVYDEDEEIYVIHRVTLEDNSYMIEYIAEFDNMEEAVISLTEIAPVWRYGKEF